MLTTENDILCITGVDQPPEPGTGREMQTAEPRTFLLPASIWRWMFASYAIFFVTILLATGRDGATVFVIAISIGYTCMYFGTAAILNSINRQNSVVSGQNIDTLTGFLGYGAAFAQIMTVPILLASFGLFIYIVRMILIP